MLKKERGRVRKGREGEGRNKGEEEKNIDSLLKKKKHKSYSTFVKSS